MVATSNGSACVRVFCIQTILGVSTHRLSKFVVHIKRNDFEKKN